MRHVPALSRPLTPASLPRLPLFSEDYYGDLDIKELAMRALGGSSSGRVAKQLEPELKRNSELELSRNVQ